MATVWLKEIHQKYINRKMDAGQEVKVSRWATLTVGVIAVGLGLLLDSSGRWLAQSAAEIGVLFYLFNAIILPAFLFAVLSRRANSMLIWLMTVYSVGDGIAMKIWYALSRSAKQAWQVGDPLGWAGPISFWYVIIPVLAGLFFITLWFIFKHQYHRKSKIMISSMLTGAFCFGFAQGILLWFIFSNTLIGELPEARSFAFSLPLTIIVGFIALRFSPVQPREKYQGLTLKTINEPIIKKLES